MSVTRIATPSEQRIERALPVLAVIAMGLMWWGGYRFTRFIASPAEVLGSLPAFLAQGETWLHIGITLQRLLFGLVLGTVTGVASALAMTRYRPADRILGVYVALALRLPSAIAAIIALAVFQRSELGFVAVIAVITWPFVTVGLLDGLASSDGRLDAMSQIYHVRGIAKLRHVVLPGTAPYLFSALRNAHALAWKIIVVAEIFGAAVEGFGGRFNHAFDHFLLVELMQWLLVFIAFVLTADYGLLRSIERRVFRWRDGKEDR